MKINMKNIKSLFVIAILFISSVIFAQQQDGSGKQGKKQGPPPIPNTTQINEMVSKLATEISLSDAQKASVLKLYTEHFEQVKAKTSGETKPPREEMEAFKASFEKNVKALLSAEQQIKFDAFQQKHKQHKGGQQKQ